MAAYDMSVLVDAFYLRVYARRRALFIRHPALIARPTLSEGRYAFGENAARALTLFPNEYEPIRPFSGGVVTDTRLAELLFKRALKAAGTIFRPSVVLCQNSYDGDTLAYLLRNAGASRVNPVKVSACSAPGRSTELCVDIGERALLSGLTSGEQSADLGLSALCGLLMRSLRADHRLLIGRSAALRALESETETLSVTGRCLDTGLPQSVAISAAERDAMIRPVTDELLSVVRDLCRGKEVVLSGSPPAAMALAFQQAGLTSGDPIADKTTLINALNYA